jgi:hypothetical protein
MTNNMNLIRAAADAFSTIDRLTACDCIETLPRDRNCIHFDASTALRDLLIDRNYSPTHDAANPLLADPDYPIYDFIRALLSMIDAAPYQTQRLSMLYLDNSLCPMHHCDYAICFDDDEPDCATIRAYFPDHDT